MSASATPTPHPPPATTSSAASSATDPADSTPRRANLGSCESRPMAALSKPLATGFRNPDGLGLAPDGTITVPNSEGDWTPASMICEIRPGGHYGYTGPKDKVAPDLPLVYLPRGLDNSSGGQVTVPDGRFGPLEGQLLHFSFGMGTHFLVLREKVDGQPQGRSRPLARRVPLGRAPRPLQPQRRAALRHRHDRLGIVHPRRRLLSESALHRRPAQLPTAFHAHENGVLLTFSLPLDKNIAERSRSLICPVVELPLRPQLRLARALSPPPGPARPRLARDQVGTRPRPTAAPFSSRSPSSSPSISFTSICARARAQPIDLFATVHNLAPRVHRLSRISARFQRPSPPIRSSPTWRLAHPPVPNRWRGKLKGVRTVTIEVDKNLSYKVRSFEVKAGEPIELTLINPDAVPHNWALVKPGTLATVGDLVNKIIAEPDAAIRHYIPGTDDVLVYTDVVGPAGPATDLVPCPQDARPLPVSVHASRDTGWS